MVEIAANAEVEGLAQVGNSGRYYMKNPFGKGDYEYAMYPSKKAYLRITSPVYISDSQRMKDLDTTEYYEFKVKVTGEEVKTYYTDLYGQLLDDESTMEEMLELLYGINGRENVSFKFDKCITTSLSSLV